MRTCSYSRQLLELTLLTNSSSVMFDVSSSLSSRNDGRSLRDDTSVPAVDIDDECDVICDVVSVVSEHDGEFDDLDDRDNDTSVEKSSCDFVDPSDVRERMRRPLTSCFSSFPPAACTRRVPVLRRRNLGGILPVGGRS